MSATESPNTGSPSTRLSLLPLLLFAALLLLLLATRVLLGDAAGLTGASSGAEEGGGGGSESPMGEGRGEASGVTCGFVRGKAGDGGMLGWVKEDG